MKSGRLHICWTLFSTFFLVAAITPGGGLVMLPTMTEQFVKKRNWLSDDDMLEIIAMTQSLPGIIAINMSVQVGWRICGLPGVFAATLGIVLPPFLALVIVASCLMQFTSSVLVQRFFLGVRATVCAMICVSVFKLGRKVLTGAFEIIVAVVGFALLVFLRISIPWLIIGAAVLGCVVSFGAAWRGVSRAKNAAGEQNDGRTAS